LKLIAGLASGEIESKYTRVVNQRGLPLALVVRVIDFLNNTMINSMSL